MIGAAEESRSGPEANSARTTDMLVLAMLPGLLALSVYFGWGTVVNLLWAIPAALLARRLLAVPRDRAWSAQAARAVLPGALVLAIALPPASPAWLVAAAAALAIAVRRLTQGTALPRFNPAMAALAIAWLAFPQEATRWLAPAGPEPLPTTPLGLLDALRAAFGLLSPARLDGYTMATPLEILRRDGSHTVAELRVLHAQFGTLAARGWDSAGLAFLAGGAYLAWRRVLHWQAGAGMLGALLLAAALFDDGSSASPGPPLLHLLGGGTLFAACFVLTEPHGAPRSARGRLWFGALVGVLSFALRQGGAFADGIAFAVLAANAAVALTGTHGAQPTDNGRPSAGPWRAALAALLGAAWLAAGWQGARHMGSPVAAGVTDTALRELLGGAPPAQIERIEVLDTILLGYRDARPAWRVRTQGRVQVLVLPVRTREGYAGPIELLVGIDRDGVLTGVRVVAHDETPGIGAAIADADSQWIASFRGRRAPPLDGLSGATLSAQAVNAAVARALRHFGIHRATLLEDPQPARAKDTSP